MTQTSNLNSPLGASGVHSPTQLREQAGSDILDSEVEKIQLDKSNILLLGPTGSGIQQRPCCFVNKIVHLKTWAQMVYCVLKFEVRNNRHIECVFC